MKQFMSGDVAPGEMGTGIELLDVNPLVAKEKEDMYQVHFLFPPQNISYCCQTVFVLQAQGFDEYISEHLVSLNRSLPDRRDDWCKENVLVRAVTIITNIIVITIITNIPVTTTRWTPPTSPPPPSSSSSTTRPGAP